MAENFEFLSPRQFQRLSKADKDRYLLALHEHLQALGPVKPFDSDSAGTAKTKEPAREEKHAIRRTKENRRPLRRPDRSQGF